MAHNKQYLPYATDCLFSKGKQPRIENQIQKEWND